MVEEAFEYRVRQAAFHWLDVQIDIHGDVLPRSLLADGFLYQEQRVPLLGPQGIFKPRLLELPLSITTIPSGP
jgi:putative restriction endonuclease